MEDMAIRISRKGIIRKNKSIGKVKRKKEKRFKNFLLGGVRGEFKVSKMTKVGTVEG